MIFVSFVLSLVELFLYTGASGLTAYRMTNNARALFNDPQERPENPIDLFIYRLFYAPKYARISAIALAVIVSAIAQLFTMLLDSAAAQFPRPAEYQPDLFKHPAAFDRDTLTIGMRIALSLIAALCSQLIHGQRLSTETPADKAAQMRATAGRIMHPVHWRVEPITGRNSGRPIITIQPHDPSRDDFTVIQRYPGTMERPRQADDREPTIELNDDRSG